MPCVAISTVYNSRRPTHNLVTLPDSKHREITGVRQFIYVNLCRDLLIRVPWASVSAASRRAVSALRIQGIGLNRGQAGDYRDSIAGYPAGEGVAGMER